MPISRPFSKGHRADSTSSLKRAFTSRHSKPMSNDKISLPIELLSTTNVLSYDAPDVETAKLTWRYSRFLCATNQCSAAPNTPPDLSPSNSARNSSDDDGPNTSPSTPTTPHSPVSASPTSTHTPTLTDDTSVGSANSSPILELNHLSSYFPNPGPAALKRSQSARLSRKPSVVTEQPAPAVPQRAASHSKKEHEKVARQRSFRRSPNLSSPPSPMRVPDNVTEHQDAALKNDNPPFPASEKAHSPVEREMPKTAPISQHPFGAELEQLNEVAEEFHGVVQSLIDEETEYMRSLGLGKFGVDEYQSLLGLPCAWNDVFDTRKFAWKNEVTVS